MVKLVFCPTKGDINHPPLSIASLSAILKQRNIKVKAIDLNRKLFISDRTFFDELYMNFARPNSLPIPDRESIKNIDTIYNIKYVLYLLYNETKLWNNFSDTEKLFLNKLSINLENEAKVLLDNEIKIIGFSSYISNIQYSILLANIIKKKNPSIKIVFGGPTTAFMPMRDFLIESKVADFVVVGEGEHAILQIANDVFLNNNILYNVLYSSNIAPEELKPNESITKFINDLDELPFPDFSDFKLSSYFSKSKKYISLPITGSRGCVYRCSYCSETAFWRRYRQRSVKSIIGEIKNNIKLYDATTLHFNDSLINGNIKWLHEFCDTLINENINIQWISYATLKNIDNKLLLKLKKSGCVRLVYGVEHVTSKVLKSVNKISSIAKTKEILLNTVNSGIVTIANMIYGLTYESDVDYLELLNFVSDPDFENRVYFTFRSFELRMGSILSKEVMAKGNEIVNRKLTDSFISDKMTDIVSKLNVFWYPNESYFFNLNKKKQILDIFIKNQETKLNTNKYVLKSNNSSITLDRFINKESINLLKINSSKVNVDIIGNSSIISTELTLIQKIILIKLINSNINIWELAKNVFEEIKPNIGNDFNEEQVMEIIFQEVKNSCIELTQKDLLIWS